MLRHWIETNNVVQRKHTVERGVSMKTQETRNERIVSAAPARRLNLKRVRQLANEQRKGLELLAKNDGPVVEPKGSKRP